MEAKDIIFTLDKKFNEKGQAIYYKDSDGSEAWCWYHENGKLSRKQYKDASSKIECWKEYDENEQLTHYKDSTGVEEWRKNGQTTCIKYYDVTENKWIMRNIVSNNN